jgi:hypothetical protein
MNGKVLLYLGAFAIITAAAPSGYGSFVNPVAK